MNAQQVALLGAYPQALRNVSLVLDVEHVSAWDDQLLKDLQRLRVDWAAEYNVSVAHNCTTPATRNMPWQQPSCSPAESRWGADRRE